MSLLNPSLYEALRQKFGEVRVSNLSVPLRYNVVTDPITLRPVLNVVEFGETYRICCPYCVTKVGRHDTRYRLNINHRWGTFFPELGSKNFSLVRCFNEDCFSDIAIRRDFIRLMGGGISDEIVYTTHFDTNNPVPSEIELPSFFIDIRDLEKEHPARQYLINRGFDPDFVAENYGCYYSKDPDKDNIYLHNRIVFPVYLNGKLFSYQARALADIEPKYISAKGTRIHNLLYGFDKLNDHEKTAVLVEGIFDCLRFGPPALAIFGSTVSKNQAALLSEKVDNVIILLDGDLKNKPEISRNARILKSEGIKHVKVVFLPGNLDPADLNQIQIERLRRALGL